LSAAQAAAVLNVSVATVYGLCSRRKIRQERHGLGRGTIRIPEDALEEYRTSVTVETKASDYQPAKPKKFKHLT
jgi:excisionase family DNA binding protein